eukprot:Awhi_evm1s12237
MSKYEPDSESDSCTDSDAYFDDLDESSEEETSPRPQQTRPLLNLGGGGGAKTTCKTCYLPIPEDAPKCLACASPNPDFKGEIPEEKPKPTMSFGIPSNSATPTASFGIPNTSSAPSFGIPTSSATTDSTNKSTAPNSFGFGMPSQGTESKGPASFGVPAQPPQNNFGVPNSTAPATSTPPSSALGFGNPQAQQVPASKPVFGIASSLPSSTKESDSQSPAPTFPLFGAKPSFAPSSSVASQDPPSKSTFPSFGATSQATKPGLFGSTPVTGFGSPKPSASDAKAETKPPTFGLFGSSSGNQTAASPFGSGGFGKPAASSTTNESSSGFGTFPGTPQASTTSAFAAAPSPSASPSFGATPTKPLFSNNPTPGSTATPTPTKPLPVTAGFGPTTATPSKTTSTFGNSSTTATPKFGMTPSKPSSGSTGFMTSTNNNSSTNTSVFGSSFGAASPKTTSSESTTVNNTTTFGSTPLKFGLKPAVAAASSPTFGSSPFSSGKTTGQSGQSPTPSFGTGFGSQPQQPLFTRSTDPTPSSASSNNSELLSLRKFKIAASTAQNTAVLCVSCTMPFSIREQRCPFCESQNSKIGA